MGLSAVVLFFFSRCELNPRLATPSLSLSVLTLIRIILRLEEHFNMSVWLQITEVLSSFLFVAYDLKMPAGRPGRGLEVLKDLGHPSPAKSWSFLASATGLAQQL